MQGPFMAVEGLTGGGCFRAKKDKEGKKGQRASHLFLPLFALLVLFCFLSALPTRGLIRDW
jgi:hypothetical protein